MTEHPLLRSALAATTDESAHAYVRAVIARLEAVLAEALACADQARGRALLPAALRMLYDETGPLLGRSLLSGFGWIDTQHRALFAKAQQLFGAEAGKIVQPPGHEPFTPQRGVFR